MPGGGGGSDRVFAINKHSVSGWRLEGSGSGVEPLDMPYQEQQVYQCRLQTQPIDYSKWGHLLDSSSEESLKEEDGENDEEDEEDHDQEVHWDEEFEADRLSNYDEHDFSWNEAEKGAEVNKAGPAASNVEVEASDNGLRRDLVEAGRDAGQMEEENHESNRQKLLGTLASASSDLLEELQLCFYSLLSALSSPCLLLYHLYSLDPLSLYFLHSFDKTIAISSNLSLPCSIGRSESSQSISFLLLSLSQSVSLSQSLSVSLSANSLK